MTVGEEGGVGRRERLGLVAGAALFLLFALAPLPGIPPAARRMLAVTILMASWWVSEAIPLAATSLLPLVLFPLLGLASAAAAAAPYANHYVYLFMGGFMLAQAMQRWRLHRRLALHIVRRVGVSPSRVVLGFMCATAFVSMWVSNTATAAMMMPIGLAVIHQVAETIARRPDATDVDVRPGHFHFGTALMLGIAYGASIGGIGSLIGTPPNLLLAGTLRETYGIELSFVRWLAFGIPFVALYVPATWWYLTRLAFPIRLAAIPGGIALIDDELRSLGPMGPAERRTAVVFALTAAAWTLRPLWSRLLPTGELVADSTVAVASALALFLLPAGERPGRLLDWESASRLPWDVLVLFGGGFSLAAGVETSGLAAWIGERLHGLSGAPLPLFLLATILLIVVLTEFASNTASAAMALPILAATASAMDVSPLVLCLPAAVAASCAFMMPAATPPNAIVFGTGYVTIVQMVRAGVGVNLIGVVLVWLAALFVLGPLFGV